MKGFVCLVLACVGVALCKECSICGKWYNELGSQMIINGSVNGIFYGDYYTAVGKPEDMKKHMLIGQSSTGPEQLRFGFTVIWPNGGSVTSWTGQSLLCGDKQTLMTTWILTSKVSKCDDNWKANRIGQDIFTRTKVKDGSGRKGNTHNPREFARHLEQEEIDDQLDL